MASKMMSGREEDCRAGIFRSTSGRREQFGGGADWFEATTITGTTQPLLYELENIIFCVAAQGAGERLSRSRAKTNAVQRQAASGAQARERHMGR